MPEMSDRKYERMQSDLQRQEDHRWNRHLAKQRRTVAINPRTQRVGAANREMPCVSADPQVLIGVGACCERGCPFPAAWLIHDQWGKLPYCDHHRRQLELVSSLDDRQHPLLVGKDGHLDGIHTDHLPLPTVFGLRVPFGNLVRVGTAIVSGRSMASAAKESEVSVHTVKRFISLAGLPYPNAEERLRRITARREQKKLEYRQRCEQRAEERLRLAQSRIKQKADYIRTYWEGVISRQVAQAADVSWRRQQLFGKLAGLDSKVKTEAAIVEILKLGPAHRDVIADTLGLHGCTTVGYLARLNRQGLTTVSFGTGTYRLIGSANAENDQAESGFQESVNVKTETGAMGQKQARG